MAHRNYPELSAAEIKQADERARNSAINQSAITEAIRQRSLEFLQREEQMIESMMESMEDRIRIDEYMFRENFLPFLDGSIKDRLPPGVTEEQLRTEAMQTWWAISGGIHNEVDVVDATGKVCFTVPPTSETNLLHMDSSKNDLQAVNEFQMEKRAGLPTFADEILNDGLNRKLKHLLSKPAVHDETIKKVDQMYRHYNLTPPSEEKKAAQAPEHNPADEFDF